MDASRCSCNSVIQCRRCRDMEHHIRKDPAEAIKMALRALELYLHEDGVMEERKRIYEGFMGELTDGTSDRRSLPRRTCRCGKS